MVVYLDVLVIINLFITYFLLLSVKTVLHRTISKKRLLLGALVGGISSLIILLPSLPAVILVVVKFLIALAISIVTFGMPSWMYLLKNTGVFFGMSFCFAGLMMALWYFAAPSGMQYRNGAVYFNLSAIVLMVSTVVSYGGICLFERFFKPPPAKKLQYDLQVTCDGKTVLLAALLDTGNQLHDILTGLPVIVCTLEPLQGLMSDELYTAFLEKKPEMITNQLWTKRIRMIPLQAVTGSSIAMSFKPDRIVMIQEEQQKEVEALIAVSPQKLSDGEYAALIGNACLKNES